MSQFSYLDILRISSLQICVTCRYSPCGCCSCYFEDGCLHDLLMWIVEVNVIISCHFFCCDELRIMCVVVMNYGPWMMLWWTMHFQQCCCELVMNYELWIMWFSLVIVWLSTFSQFYVKVVSVMLCKISLFGCQYLMFSCVKFQWSVVQNSIEMLPNSFSHMCSIVTIFVEEFI